MNIFKIVYIRTFQKVLKIGSSILNFRVPKVYNSFKDIPSILKEESKHTCLLVSDKNILELGLLDELIALAAKSEIKIVPFTAVDPNPTFENINEGKKAYLDSNCDSIVAVGGGSVMDAAKVIGTLITNKKTIPQLKGLFKLRHRLPLLLAAPTTCGTGSEATLAAVIRNKVTKEKFPIEDLKLIPRFAILDPYFIANLPQKILATTCLDALTHAVEAFIGQSTTKKTRKYAVNAVKLILNNVNKAYDNKDDLEAKKNLLTASFDAGVAFTKSYVGYVHAIAHQIGGLYNLPHGYLNAIILPIILEEYGNSIDKKITILMRSINFPLVSDDEKENRLMFIKRIRDLNKKFNIPSRIKEIEEQDIHLLSVRAYKEATPLYPVPKLLSEETLEDIIRNKIKEKTDVK
ncbi:MAG: iron-containing alcohol dehydrogenase [Bacilli bacterium]